jgi:hypothetical protein
MTVPSGFPPGDTPPSGGYPTAAGHPTAFGEHPAVPYPNTLPKSAYTPWLTRVAACLIDVVPLAVLAAISQGIIQFATTTDSCVTDETVRGYALSCSSHPSTLGVAASLGFGLLAAFFAVWNYGYRQGITGSSIGKSIMRFKVIDQSTDRPIGFGRSVLRQFAHLADGLVGFIGYLLPLWDAKRQTLADKIMSTVCLPV